MHTANRLSQLSSSSGKLRQWARVVLPGLLAISALFCASLIQARRGGDGGKPGTGEASAARMSAPAAATITVNNNGDTVAVNGQCTLREAINNANNGGGGDTTGGDCATGTAGLDTIQFSLGAGTPSIAVMGSALPVITEPVTIKGNSGGATRVELNGAGAGASANGLRISAGNSLIERLVVNRFTGDGIQITGAGFNTVKGCIIGLDSSGTIVRANNIGLAIRGSSDNIIGGAAAGERNIISGNTTDGVLVINNPAAASRNKLISNYIGTDATGRFDFGNTGFGVNVSGGDLTVIGGTMMGERNIISGNNGGGARIGDAAGANNKIIGNSIGLDASGTFGLGNGVSGGGGTAPGVLIEDAPNNFVGGTSPGELNFISNNNQNGGVVITGNSATGNRVLGNSISANSGLGIDLGNNGVTGNDSLDADIGPNNLQNSPLLSSVIPGGNSTTIFGSLDSLPSRSFRIEFFFSTQCDPSGFGEGQSLLGSIMVGTNAGGTVSFSPTFNDIVLPAGQAVTATATLLDGSNNPIETSEFSACQVVTNGPLTCTSALNPTAQNMRAPGGNFSVEVSLAPSCAWSASSSLPWATITSGSPGLGSGTVVINVAANPGPQRLGQLTIAGKDFFVIQEGPCTASLNPPAQNFAAAGGIGAVELSTGSGCAWTATSTVGWVTLTTAGSGSGPTVVDFTVAANPSSFQRAGSIVIAGQTSIIVQDAPCTATINPTIQQFPPTVGSNSVNVMIAPTCNWTATTTDPWITINSGASGMGNGTVNYSVTANPGGQRSGAISVAGKTLIVSQAGSCAPTLNPANQTVASGGGNHSVAITIGATCNWPVSTSTPWITITSPANNTGNGTVNYMVAANAGTQRTGSIAIAGQNFSVTQDGACSYSISPSFQQFVVAGGNGTVNVTATTGCGWMATTAAPWITITSGASGTGNGTVNYSVATNGTGSQRGGTITIGGQSLSVSQDGGCTYTVTPTSQNFAAAGGMSTASVTTTASCAWLATSNVPWITITPSPLQTKDERFSVGRNPAIKNGIAGTGNGTVAYTVAVNNSAARTGTMNIAGTVFTVTQDSGCPIDISPVNLSPATVNVNYSQLLTQSGGVGAINWTVVAGSLPGGMMLNPMSGLLSGAPTSMSSFSFTVRATDANNCYGEIPYLLIVNCQPLSITPATLDPGAIGSPYTQQLTLTGGSGAINWVVSAGSLPAGVSLHPTSGLLSGTPSVQGTSNFTVRATINATGCFAEKNYMLTVNCQAITVGPMTINSGNMGVPYSQQFTQSGGAGNITWSLSLGSLPNNLTLSASGLLSGTPVASGTYPITVRATDGNLCFGEKMYTLQIGVCPAISIMPNALPNGLINTNYNQTLTASGGTPGYSYAVTAGALPAGVSLSTAGALTGSPTVVGSFTFTVTATDQAGCTGTKGYTLRICGSITVNPASLPNGFVGAGYNQTLTAAGGASPYSFSSSGTLPGGLMLSSAGVLSGLPTTAGTFNFTVTAMDANTCIGSRNYTVIISGAGLMYYPLSAPVRLLDTRVNFQACNTPNAPLAVGPDTLQIAANGCTGVPGTAVAVVGNATVVNSQSGGGFITLYPSNAARPNASNLNFTANHIVPNAFTVGLGGDGGFKIFTSAATNFIIDITGYYAPPGAGGLYYHPLTAPVRLLDTRLNFQACTTPNAPLAVGPDTLQIATNGCTGVPATAKAVVGNATVVNSQSAGGWITLYPSNAARPNASNLNFTSNHIVPNAFTVGLGGDGGFKIFTSAATNFIVDVTGYYSDQAVDANGPGLLYTPLAAPVRLLDTRVNFQACNTPNAPLALAPDTLQIAANACTGVPGAAKAVVGNATVVNFQSGGGWITLYPSNAALPNASNLNFTANHIVPNAFTVGLGGDGGFKIFTSAATDFIVDIAGYFAP